MDEKVTSLYIHIPFCVSKCSYCDFFSIPTNTRQNCIPDDYINAVCEKILNIFLAVGKLYDEHKKSYHQSEINYML